MAKMKNTRLQAVFEAMLAFVLSCEEQNSGQNSANKNCERQNCENSYSDCAMEWDAETCTCQERCICQKDDETSLYCASLYPGTICSPEGGNRQRDVDDSSVLTGYYSKNDYAFVNDKANNQDFIAISPEEGCVFSNIYCTDETKENDCAPFAEDCIYVMCEDEKCLYFMRDEDRDGYLAETCREYYGNDCDDTNPNVFPGRGECLDGIDNDCDGVIDKEAYRSWECPIAVFRGKWLYPYLDHSVFWSGSEMFVWWGGETLKEERPHGGRYDPTENSWRIIHWPRFNDIEDFSGFHEHTAVWNGNEMIVWGRRQDKRMDSETEGALYDPATDTWQPISTYGAPSKDTINNTAVWTGSEMIVWGEEIGTVSGGRYNPIDDTWRTISTDNAPSRRSYHTVVWSGSEMIVWGGHRNSDGQGLQNGGRYNPEDDIWFALNLTGAPSGRAYHTAVWSGSEMIVWGGSARVDGQTLNTGAKYNPRTDNWTPMTLSDAPTRRYWHTAVWSGAAMFVYGGLIQTNWEEYACSGALYIPDSDRWISIPNGPCVQRPNSIWTGSEVILWDPSGEGYRFAP